MSKAMTDSNFPFQTEKSDPTWKHLSKLDVLLLYQNTTNTSQLLMIIGVERMLFRN
jgi:hypothetical protein